MPAGQHHKLITAILPKGMGIDMLKKLKKEKGIIAANVESARGMGHLTPEAHRGAGEQAEKDMLNVIIDAAEADALFEYIYETAEINKPHGGLLFMSRLQRATHYSLPDLPDED
jgi:nitrogen regulatory protein PII